ncbi:hypothetical protein IQ264_01255 [Phormidium sp. LEGE 05292]|uniref:hypothetical protein n=1 Tax=[Phormidium] sp. LEGE 05292 TaxID=767427 RepID=UPI001881AA22|nr:hypothetical protein [Phormidium sp. LEGE 05292]MBE9224100.1 hypothetical protein [Phormidium sp. LEGE 05292]
MEALESLELFAKLVQQRLGRPLTGPERILFQGFWQGLKYDEISTQYNFNYAPDHIRKLGSQLTNLAALICEQPAKTVNKNVFRSALEPYLKQVQRGSNPADLGGWALQSHFFHLVRQAQRRDWYSPEDYLDFAHLLEQMSQFIKEASERDGGAYQEIVDRWQLVKNFSHVYEQHWEQREQILRWLLVAAKASGDRPIIAESYAELGLTRILRDPYTATAQSEAKFYLEEAQKLATHREVVFCIDLQIYQAMLSLAKGLSEDASTHLTRAKLFLGQQWPDSRVRDRCLSNIHYYEGECYFHIGQYKKADEQYKSARQYAKAIGWKRAEVAVNNWRAEIAIQFGNLEQADRLLNQGIVVVEQHRDWRSLALHQQSMGLLKQKQGDLKSAHHWATKAKDWFIALSMNAEAQEIQKLLQQLN